MFTVHSCATQKRWNMRVPNVWNAEPTCACSGSKKFGAECNSNVVMGTGVSYLMNYLSHLQF